MLSGPQMPLCNLTVGLMPLFISYPGIDVTPGIRDEQRHKTYSQIIERKGSPVNQTPQVLLDNPS